MQLPVVVAVQIKRKSNVLNFELIRSLHITYVKIRGNKKKKRKFDRGFGDSRAL